MGEIIKLGPQQARRAARQRPVETDDSEKDKLLTEICQLDTAITALQYVHLVALRRWHAFMDCQRPDQVKMKRHQRFLAKLDDDIEKARAAMEKAEAAARQRQKKHFAT